MSNFAWYRLYNMESFLVDWVDLTIVLENHRKTSQYCVLSSGMNITLYPLLHHLLCSSEPHLPKIRKPENMYPEVVTAIQNFNQISEM